MIAKAQEIEKLHEANMLINVATRKHFAIFRNEMARHLFLEVLVAQT